MTENSSVVLGLDACAKAHETFGPECCLLVAVDPSPDAIEAIAGDDAMRAKSWTRSARSLSGTRHLRHDRHDGDLLRPPHDANDADDAQIGSFLSPGAPPGFVSCGEEAEAERTARKFGVEV